jgi:Rod binding domain-containing protein
LAIDPASDLILDVIRAGDPERAAAAASRLAAIANAGAAASGDFGTELDETASPSSPAASAVVSDAGGARARLAAIANQNDPAAKAKADFEAMLLNGFVSEMLPKDSEAVFGQGMAGDMWKSMLADQVSRQIAKSGALGIGDRLFATHPMPSRSLNAEGGVGVGADAAAAAQASVNPLSVGASSSVVGGVVLAPPNKPT